MMSIILANGLPKVKVALYMILHADSYWWMRAFDELMIKLSPRPTIKVDSTILLLVLGTAG